MNTIRYMYTYSTNNTYNICIALYFGMAVSVALRPVLASLVAVEPVEPAAFWLARQHSQCTADTTKGIFSECAFQFDPW